MKTKGHTEIVKILAINAILLSEGEISIHSQRRGPLGERVNAEATGATIITARKCFTRHYHRDAKDLRNALR